MTDDPQAMTGRFGPKRPTDKGPRTAEELTAAFRAHEDERHRGAYPHLGQDNDIRRFAEWVADWLEARDQWLTDEPTEATNAAMNYGQGFAQGVAAARAAVEGRIKTTTYGRNVEFTLSHSEYRVPVEAVRDWLRAALDTTDRP